MKKLLIGLLAVATIGLTGCRTIGGTINVNNKKQEARIYCRHINTNGIKQTSCAGCYDYDDLKSFLESNNISNLTCETIATSTSDNYQHTHYCVVYVK